MSASMHRRSLFSSSSCKLIMTCSCLSTGCKMTQHKSLPGRVLENMLTLLGRHHLYQVSIALSYIQTKIAHRCLRDRIASSLVWMHYSKNLRLVAHPISQLSSKKQKCATIDKCLTRSMGLDLSMLFQVIHCNTLESIDSLTCLRAPLLSFTCLYHRLLPFISRCQKAYKLRHHLRL